MAYQKTGILTVTRPQELTLFCKAPKRIQVKLSLPALSFDENAFWEQRLNKWRNECGCRTSTVGLFLGSIICFASFNVSVLSSVKHALIAFSFGIVITLAFAVAGKFLGLGVARARLKYSIKMLSQRRPEP